MILLPDEDEKPVAAQVYAVIGEALRQSVAEAEPSPEFARRLAAVLDASARGADDVAGEAGGVAEAGHGVAEEGASGVAAAAAPGEAGQGSEAAEVAS